MILSLVCVSIVTCLIMYGVMYDMNILQVNLNIIVVIFFGYIFLVYHIHACIISCIISFFLFCVVLLLFYHQNNKPLWQTGKNKWMLNFYCLFIVKSGFHLRKFSNGNKEGSYFINLYFFAFMRIWNMSLLAQNRPNKKSINNAEKIGICTNKEIANSISFQFWKQKHKIFLSLLVIAREKNSIKTSTFFKQKYSVVLG